MLNKRYYAEESTNKFKCNAPLFCREEKKMCWCMKNLIRVSREMDELEKFPCITLQKCKNKLAMSEWYEFRTLPYTGSETVSNAFDRYPETVRDRLQELLKASPTCVLTPPPMTLQ
ncbi:unnamed protein product [Brugia pahangi]|uniref:Thyroglobulin type-1 domain-containing protein n=1 Tax=Brugia pahangi TaxID=6280 RepID=A0A0N4TQF3_BRUPA|nr:unnamed protein product [Brugia pahangi]